MEEGNGVATALVVFGTCFLLCVLLVIGIAASAETLIPERVYSCTEKAKKLATGETLACAHPDHRIEPVDRVANIYVCRCSTPRLEASP